MMSVLGFSLSLVEVLWYNYGLTAMHQNLITFTAEELCNPM